MCRIILVTGGSRSGKSSYAERLGESLPGPRAYLATCPVIDEEILCRGVNSLQFLYFDGTNWLPNWDSTSRRGAFAVSAISTSDRAIAA